MRRFKGVYLMVVMLVVVSCASSDKKDESRKQVSSRTKAAKASEEKTLSKHEKQGKRVFETNGCIACHQLDQKLVGPSLVDIAAAYSGNRDHLVEFFQGKRKSIINPEQDLLMKSSLALTKVMPQGELEALVDYVLAHP